MYVGLWHDVARGWWIGLCWSSVWIGVSHGPRTKLSDAASRHGGRRADAGAIPDCPETWMRPSLAYAGDISMGRWTAMYITDYLEPLRTHIILLEDDICFLFRP
jgi:hypothetical protein